MAEPITAPATIAAYAERTAAYIEAVGRAAVRKAEDHNKVCLEFAEAIREAGRQRADEASAFFVEMSEAQERVREAADRFGKITATIIDAEVAKIEAQPAEQGNGQDH